MKYIIIVVFFAVSCKNTVEAPLKGKWHVISKIDDKAFNKTKINVRVNERLNEDDLNQIAAFIKQENPRFRKVDIFYLLSGMDPNKGAWAASYFEPNLRTKIFGSTQEEESKMKSTGVSGKIIGKWKDVTPVMTSIIYLVEENESKYIKTVYSNGEKSVKEVTLVPGKSGKIIKYKKASENYLRIESNGNISHYDSEGKIRSCAKAD